jgi:hypothetical protein
MGYWLSILHVSGVRMGNMFHPPRVICQEGSFMPRRRKLRVKEQMSPEALEALSVSVLRRLAGFEYVTRVIIEKAQPDESGTNWDISIPGAQLDNLVRARAALSPWRNRFDLVS